MEPPAAPSSGDAGPVPAPSRSSQTWAMLTCLPAGRQVKRVFEIDPLACPECGGQMKVVALIEPSQGDVIEKILRGHRRAAMVGGLWCPSSPRAPPAEDGWVHGPDGDADSQTTSSDEPRELTFVDEETLWATF